MTGDRPEDHRECHSAGRDKNRDPDRAAEEELLDVWLADVQCAERCGLGLAEEDEHRIELVLVRDEEEDGDRVREEEL